MNMTAMGKVTRFCVHHSAGASGSAEEFRMEHKAKGWADIGYHAVIGNGHGDVNGHVAPGREERFQGSGVFGANSGVLHVCLVGNFCETHPTQEQLRSLGHWLLNRSRRYGAKTIYGHNEMAIKGHGTACPGDYFLNPVKRTGAWAGVTRLGVVRYWCELRMSAVTMMELDQFLAHEGLL